ncbi:uncharacterized protein LOC123672187 [Harmonia axyridis]|uniref:uncharacterized protein LOC123672187 n=1 Tax=Harmonia axyridis TaxID=115357 RepID=UPI001E279781|nr:uncharacterized protein LOC123672187 [Harmonia axyridis]
MTWLLDLRSEEKRTEILTYGLHKNSFSNSLHLGFKEPDTEDNPHVRFRGGSSAPQNCSGPPLEKNWGAQSKLLQSKEFDLSAATSQLEKTKEFLKTLRSDSGFEKILDNAKDIAMNLGLIPFLELNEERIRRKPRHFDYEARDEVIVDANQKFKISFYFTILDRALFSIEERLNQINQINNNFGFLFDIHNLKLKSQKELLDACTKVELALSDGEEKDIDGLDLKHEIVMIADVMSSQSSSSPIQTLEYIYNNMLEEGFPNLCIVLRIILTLPMSVASAERSFSKLKLIKSYVRNSMT